MAASPPFTTARLVLRDFVPEDTALVRNYRQDPRYLEHYPQNDDPMMEAATFVACCRDWAAQRPRRKFQLALVLRADRRLVGNAGLRLSATRGASGEIGYELDPRFWGRGLAGEAVGALLAFGFDALELRQIEATTAAANSRSSRLLGRLGFGLEKSLAAGPDADGRPQPKRCVYVLKKNTWSAAHAGETP